MASEWLPTPPKDPLLATLELFLKVADREQQQTQAPYHAYAQDPVGFFRDVLGVEPWGRAPSMPHEHGTQVEILEAVRDHDKVAVRSGHKVSKSSSASGIALWWIYTRTDGRVTLTAPANHQVESILWSELRLLHSGEHPGRRKGHQRKSLPGKLHIDCRAGLVIRDGWGCWGLTTNEPERMSGKSGSKQLYIVDESSGYPEEIYTSIFGNLAGGGKVLLISNPTRTAGTFYDVFHSKGGDWKRIWIASTSTPNFHGGRIDGLADPKWEEWAREHWGGPGAPLYDMRVLGRFPSQADNAVVPLDLVEVASARSSVPSEEDDLDLGVDVAREGDDESIISPVRGLHAYPMVSVKLDRDPNAIPLGHQVGEVVLATAKRMKGKSRRVRIKVDVIGVGASVVDYLLAQRSALSTELPGLEVIPVNVGAAADKELVVVPSVDQKPALTAYDTYRNLRAQVWFGVRDWLRAGGSIPKDEKLRAELVAVTYKYADRGKIVVQEKSEIKKVIKRSPDRADALCLAVYTPPKREVARGVGLTPLGFF